MLCLSPLIYGTSGPFPCGRCEGCRINRRRDWTARLLLHHAGHKGASLWTTLTYDDSHMPVRNGVGVLSRVDVRNFIQRLRREVGKLRYVIVGEYGSNTMRPHYHALLWFEAKDVSPEWFLPRCWIEGYSSTGEVCGTTIEYTIGYLLKGMVKPDDIRLQGRVPEFARYSHGLGSVALSELRRLSRPGVDGVLTLPREFRVDGRVWPIPKYVRSILSEEGYVFTRMATEIEEEAFVRALRAGASSTPWDSIMEFREAVKEEVIQRRVRSRHRVLRRLTGDKKYETL